MYHNPSPSQRPWLRLLWTILYFWAVRFLCGALIWGGLYLLDHGTEGISTLLTIHQPVDVLVRSALRKKIFYIPLSNYCMMLWTFVSLWLSVMTIRYRMNSTISIPEAFHFAWRMAPSIAFWTLAYGILWIIGLDLPMPFPLVFILIYFSFFYLPAAIQPSSSSLRAQAAAALRLFTSSAVAVLLQIGLGLLYVVLWLVNAIGWSWYFDVGVGSSYAVVAAIPALHLFSVGKDLLRAYVAQRALHEGRI